MIIFYICLPNCIQMDINDHYIIILLDLKHEHTGKNYLPIDIISIIIQYNYKKLNMYWMLAEIPMD